MAVNFQHAANQIRLRHTEVFSNRSIDLAQKKYVGMDLDFTVAEYKVDTYYRLIFDLIIDSLSAKKDYKNYKEYIRGLKIDLNFCHRGLWIDFVSGNILKVDDQKTVQIAFQGLERLTDAQIENAYPGRFLQFSNSRVFITNTSYDAPVAAVYASLVSLFDEKATKSDNVLDLTASWKAEYKEMFTEILGVVKDIHETGLLHNKTVEHLDQYLNKSPRLIELLMGLKAAGHGTFLLTNSGYTYTNTILSYLTETSDWHQLFDYIIVDAKKPQFFDGNAKFTTVDKVTGLLRGFGRDPKVPLEKGCVYSGGCVEILAADCNGVRGDLVLYVGDHIWGDILRSKKQCGWDTLFMAPEIAEELNIRIRLIEQYKQLGRLEHALHMRRIRRGLADVGDLDAEELDMRLRIRNLRSAIDNAYGRFGGVFSHSSGDMFFGAQLKKYASLYATSLYNLANYSPFHYYRGSPVSLPHEIIPEPDMGAANVVGIGAGPDGR